MFQNYLEDWNKNVTFAPYFTNKSLLIMKFSEFYKLLEEHGWRKDGGSRHEHYVHPDYDYFIPVGRHPSKEVPKGTLNKMLKDAGIKK